MSVDGEVRQWSDVRPDEALLWGTREHTERRGELTAAPPAFSPDGAGVLRGFAYDVDVNGRKIARSTAEHFAVPIIPGQPGPAAGPPTGSYGYFYPQTYALTFQTQQPKPAPLAGEAAPADNQKPKPEAPAQPNPPAVDPAPAGKRVVLRSGEVEFEVDSFDAALATASKLVAAIPGAYVGTVNSDKLPNGKVKGSVTVRVPPDHLDGLVLDLRAQLGKAGELKGQRITSQDVTKQYTDLESRLRAARTMEQRLLQIIKEGKGEIKELLEAEKELGVWRTKIEEFEGELRYYANLAALSTLTITLAERDIRAAAGVTECERVQAGIEVEDVEKAYRDALAAVLDAKGRVTRSELKQLAAGQFNAPCTSRSRPTPPGRSATAFVNLAGSPDWRSTGSSRRRPAPPRRRTVR
jgi:hypothetical protein